LLARIKAEATYNIDVGDDLMWDINREWLHAANDPTVHALELQYNPSLAPGEEKSYLLRLPALDKPEAAPYGNNWRPFDTGDSWKPYMENRHPQNKTPHGEDVPPGMDPAQYAVNGPKSKKLWERQVANARSVSWPEAIKRLKDYWEQYVQSATKFDVPEPYIDFLYKHQLAVLKLHQIRFAPSDYYLQFTGPDWYWDIAISRDVPYMYHAYDLVGLKEDSTRLWRTILTSRTELPRSRYTAGQWSGKPEVDGLWITRTGQWDSQGQLLWGLADHYLLTGDRQWLDHNYANIIRGAEWIMTAIQLEKEHLGNPEAIGYGMLPPSTPEGGGPGHNYYASSYAILGLHSVARLAGIKGEPDRAVRYQEQANELKESVHRAVRAGFFRYNDFAGTIPFGPEWFPGPQLIKDCDGRKVCTVMPDTDFGCPLIWPTESMAPFNPMMNAWCINRETLAEKKAGVFGWAYIAVDYGLSYLRRGEPDRAADWFYVYVDHASGCLDWGEGVDTKAVFTEYDPPRPGIRAGGQMPHGWASAMYVSYLRNLMLQEQGNDLHIAPGTPRKWLGQSQPIGVEHAPTQFGTVSYKLQADPDRETIHGRITLNPQRKPERLLVHVRAPGGRGIRKVSVNGQNWNAFVGDTVVITNPGEQSNLEVKYEPD
jgi:hypothetical protein